MKSEQLPVPRNVTVRAPRPASRHPSIRVANAAATTSRPKERPSTRGKDAASPASPAASIRWQVQINQRMCGRPTSPRRPRAATVIAASGPNTTAANRTGRTETANSLFELTRTGCLSASKAAAAKTPIIQMGSPGNDCTRNTKKPSPAVATTRLVAHHCRGPNVLRGVELGPTLLKPLEVLKLPQKGYTILGAVVPRKEECHACSSPRCTRSPSCASSRGRCSKALVRLTKSYLSTGPHIPLLRDSKCERSEWGLVAF